VGTGDKVIASGKKKREKRERKKKKSTLSKDPDMGSIPGSGRSRGEGNGNPLHYSCLGNPTDRGAWQPNIPWNGKRVRYDLVTQQQHNERGTLRV